MSCDRIVVGFDGSPASRAALVWAVREARVTGAVVNVVSAWTPLAEGPPQVAAISGRQRERQVAAIRAALNGLPPGRRPVVTGQVVQADPVIALATAASTADLVVIGFGPGGGGLEDRLTAQLTGWSRPFGSPCPIRTVRVLPPPDPSERSVRPTASPNSLRDRRRMMV